ncbi:MAG: SRPBCC domain-containing protein [Planctomyces sp.]|nr:SRPBCC domain-containing protein [Planctomyces sp.]
MAEGDPFRTLNVRKDVVIAAPVEIAWEATLAQLGPECEMPGGAPFPMTFEAWPGGRWFRDLGEGVGHLWGHVQVIKPPKLIELCGPMFMSYPAISHVQYRFSEAPGGSRLELIHRAMGLIPDDHMASVGEGWQYFVDRIETIARRRLTSR